ASAFLEYPGGVLHFLPASQLVEDVPDEPLQQLADELAGGQLLALAEVDQLAVQPVAHRAPLVLLDQGSGIYPEGEVVVAKLPELPDDRLEDRADAHRLRYPGADVADPKFERGIAPARAYVPPDLGGVRDGVRRHHRLDQLHE